jgi:hypothetical protein
MHASAELVCGATDGVVQVINGILGSLDRFR